MNERPSSAPKPETEVALDFNDTQALRALTAEGQLPSLLILSTDAQLIDVARKAAPTGMAIADAADIDEISARLPTFDPGILLIDTAGVRDVALMLPRLTQYFPDIVVIVVGHKEDSGTLFRLTAEGRVFRFLLKPLSHGQARLALKAAATQHITSAGVRRSVPAPLPRPRTHLIAYGALAVAAVMALGGVWYAIDRFSVEPAAPVAQDSTAPNNEPRAVPERVDPVVAELALGEEAFAAGHYLEPRGESALDAFRNAIALDPTNEAARLGVRRVADKVLERAEAALTAENLEEAMRSIETARDIDPTHSRLAFLDVQVARERERLRLTQERGVDERIRALLATAEEHMRSGRLLEPAAGNARRTLLNARRIDPTDPAVARSMREFTTRLTEEASAALRGGSLEQAETFVSAARELGSAGAALADIERQLLQAQRTARAPMPEAPAPATPPASAREPVAVAAAPVPETTSAPAGEPGEPVEALGIPRTREVPAKYPREALLSRVEGYVDLEFTISPQGIPEDLVVRESRPRRAFDRAAMDAVRRWRFQPVMRDGVPVAQRAKMRMIFKP